MASKKRRRKNESAPGWAWMLFGLSIGLAIALVVYLKSGQPLFPEQRAAAPVAAETPRADTEAPSPEPETAATARDEPPGGPVVEPDDPALSFYNGLKDLEVVVDDGEFDFGDESETPQQWMIQAGAFPSFDGADRRQANIALLGIESHIEPAIVNGELYYRVRIGPLVERGEFNRTRRLLRGQGIKISEIPLPTTP